MLARRRAPSSRRCSRADPEALGEPAIALRDKLTRRAQPLLEPGEEIQQIFLVKEGPRPGVGFVHGLDPLFTTYEVVVATDQALVIMRASMWQSGTPKKVLRRLPRRLQIRYEPRALWSQTSLPGDSPTWVHRRFYGDVEAANAAWAEQPPAAST